MTHRHTDFLSITTTLTVLTLLQLLAAPACTSDDGSDENAADSSSGAATDGGPTADGPTADGPVDDTGTDDAPATDDGTTAATGESSGGSEGSTGETVAQLEIVEAFDPAMGQLPEGLAVQGDAAYVAFAVTGQVFRVDLTGAEAPAAYASVPPLAPNMSFITGLAFDADDRLYIALPSFVADPIPGVYRADAGGGDATLFATHDTMVFPSGMRFDAEGNMYLTDSMSATVFLVTPDGTATPWITDPILAGDKTFCGHDDALFDIGANGIAITDASVFVAVSDHAAIVEIPILDDGTAGVPVEIVGPDCEALGGIDDMERADDGTFFAALNVQNRIGRVDADGTVGVLVEDPLLDFPATVRFGDKDGAPALYVTSFALTNAVSGMRAHPSLAVWSPLE